MSGVLTGRVKLVASLGVSCLVVAAFAQAKTPIRVTASPQIVSHGQKVTVRGSGWGVIEFCKPRVTLMLARPTPLGALPITTVNLRTGRTTSGSFSTSWIVPATVRSGLHTIIATQRCESGKNGSVRMITRTTPIRVK